MVTQKERKTLIERVTTDGPYTWQSAALRAAVIIDDYYTPRDPSNNTALVDLRKFLDHMVDKRDGTWLAWACLAERTIHAAIDHGVTSWTTGKGKPRAKQLVGFLTEKQKAYGYENIRRFGQTGLWVRSHDKVARMENLVAMHADPGWEPLADTFKDLVGYSTIGIVLDLGTFGLPVSGHVANASV